MSTGDPGNLGMAYEMGVDTSTDGQGNPGFYHFSNLGESTIIWTWMKGIVAKAMVFFFFVLIFSVGCKI